MRESVPAAGNDPTILPRALGRAASGPAQAENIAHNLALVARLSELAADEYASPAQLALAWVLGRRPFVVPILGTRQSRWLEENVDAVHLSRAPATLAALDGLFAPGAVAGPRYGAAEKRRVEL